MISNRTKVLKCLVGVSTMCMALYAAAEEREGPVSSQPKTRTVVIGHSVGWLGITETTEFNVILNDQVSDGCWTNPQAIKNAVKLELQRSGYKVVDDEDLFATHLVTVSGLGAFHSTRCVVTYSLDVDTFTYDRFRGEDHLAEGMTYRSLWERNGVLSGSKDAMNSQLREQYMTFIQEFLVSIDERQEEALEAIRTWALEDEAADYWSNFSLD